jgi:hypothetical protein
VAYETLFFQICHANVVPELLREFLNNNVIMFWGAAIQLDVQMMEYYEITIPEVSELQMEVPNQHSTILRVSML